MYRRRVHALAPSPGLVRLGQLTPGSTGESGQFFQTTGGQVTVVALNAVGAVAAYGIPIGSIVGALASLFGGGQVLTHEQREQLELQRTVGQVNQMIGEIHNAPTVDALWATLVKWNSGTVGGTSSQAVEVLLNVPWPLWPQLVAAGAIVLGTNPGVNTLEGVHATWANIIDANGYMYAWAGKPNIVYPALTPRAFFQLLVQNPAWLDASTQAGVTQSKLVASNQAVASAILGQLAKILQSQSPLPAQAALTPILGPQNLVTTPQAIVPGPTGALPMAQAAAAVAPLSAGPSWLVWLGLGAAAAGAWWLATRAEPAPAFEPPRRRRRRAA